MGLKSTTTDGGSPRSFASKICVRFLKKAAANFRRFFNQKGKNVVCLSLDIVAEYHLYPRVKVVQVSSLDTGVKVNWLAMSSERQITPTKDKKTCYNYCELNIGLGSFLLMAHRIKAKLC